MPDALFPRGTPRGSRRFRPIQAAPRQDGWVLDEPGIRKIDTSPRPGVPVLHEAMRGPSGSAPEGPRGEAQVGWIVLVGSPRETGGSKREGLSRDEIG